MICRFNSQQISTPTTHTHTQSQRLPTLTPQQYLDALCRTRGYNTERYPTLQGAFHNRPTPLQLASYDIYLINLVKSGNVAAVQALLDAGISPNPCNRYGESLLHMVCRQGHAAMLELLIQAGACLQVVDDYGRTPLHDACWGAEPNFDCVRLLLNASGGDDCEDNNNNNNTSFFYMTDKRGAEPLSYVRREHWAAWIEFLESVKNEYWPHKKKKNTGDATTAAVVVAHPPPPRTLQAPNSRPIPDPANALPTEMARLLVQGKMTPDEVAYLMVAEDDDGSSDLEDSDFSDDSDFEDDDDEDGSEMDAEEMAAILHSLNLPSRG